VIVSHTHEIIESISQTIAGGGVVAFRTDTFYGLGANPFDRQAVQRIRDLKGREDRKPILIVVSGRDQVSRFIPSPSRVFVRLAEEFWPGPLTLIGEAAAEVSDEVSAGTRSVGLRFPADKRVLALIAGCGGALTATSANPSGKMPARTAMEADAYFGEKIDMIVDDGEAQTDRPSTVVSVEREHATLIREGVISWAEVQETLKQIHTN
jgi:L-threonylcarbamoyladenylate synthase